jgi:hypothetical protein
VGVFDISHMGQFIVEDAGGQDWLNGMLTNNVDKLDVGKHGSPASLGFALFSHTLGRGRLTGHYEQH